MFRKILKTIENLIFHPYGTLHYFFSKPILLFRHYKQILKNIIFQLNRTLRNFFYELVRHYKQVFKNIIFQLNKTLRNLFYERVRLFRHFKLALKIIPIELVLDDVKVAEKLEIKEIFTPKGKLLQICWILNNSCTYRCSYCHESICQGKISCPQQSIDHYITSFEKFFLYYIKKGYNGCYIFLSGGEPTIWKALPEITKQLKDLQEKYFKYNAIGINTNLSKDMEWWKKNHTLYDIISVSFHVEFADKDQFIKKIKFLYLHGNTTIRLLLHDERFNEVVELGERIKKECKNYIFEYVPLFSSLDANGVLHKYKDQYKVDFINRHTAAIQDSNFSYSKKRYEIYEIFTPLARYNKRVLTSAISNILIINGQNKFKGWKCEIDSNLFIRSDGKIFFGSGSCKMATLVGNIETGIFTPNISKMICNADFCNCAGDINIPKKKL